MAVFATAEEPLDRKAENAHGVGWQETARCALPGLVGLSCCVTLSRRASAPQDRGRRSHSYRQ